MNFWIFSWQTRASVLQPVSQKKVQSPSVILFYYGHPVLVKYRSPISTKIIGSANGCGKTQNFPHFFNILWKKIRDFVKILWFSASFPLDKQIFAHFFHFWTTFHLSFPHFFHFLWKNLKVKRSFNIFSTNRWMVSVGERFSTSFPHCVHCVKVWQSRLPPLVDALIS